MATNLAKLGFDISSRPMREASRELDRMAVSSGRAEKSSRTLASASNAVRNAVTGLIAAISVREVVQYADSWQNVANQLRQVTDGTRELTDIQTRLVNVAKDTRSNFDSTANLYARLARSTTEMGLSTEDLIGLTTTINQSFAVSGATATEAAAAITQLSQGLAAGALRGEEFNSVSEQAPALMRAIGASLNMTIGELRDFAAEGGITAEIVVNALRKASDEIDTNFNKTVATFGQNIEVARTNLMQWIGTNTAITSSVSSVGDVIVEVSENIDELATVAGAALLVWMGRLTGSATASAAAMVSKQRAIVSSAAATAKATATEISYLRAVQGSLSAQLASNTSATRAIALRQQLAANTAALTAAQSAYTAALSASTVAARAATGAMTALRGVMAFLGGPAGIALIAAGSLYYFRDALFSAGGEASEAVKDIDELAEGFRDLTAAQIDNERNSIAARMRENKIAIAEAREELERLQEKQSKRNTGNTLVPGGMSGVVDITGAQAGIAELVRQNEALADALTELDNREEEVANRKEDRDRRKAESAAEAVQKIIDSLDAELFKLEEGERAWLARRLQLEGATEDQIKYALSVRDSIEAAKDAQKQEEELAKMRMEFDPASAEFNRYADQIDQIEAFNITAAEKEMLREAAFAEHNERMSEIAKEGADSRSEVEQTYWQKWLESAEKNLTNFDELSKTVIDNFTRSFGDAFEAVILDSEDTEEALKEMARTMIRSVVNAIGQMIAQWIALQAVQMALGTTATAATVGQAATAAAAWAPAAAMASLATGGANAAPAAAALASTTTLAQTLSMAGGSFEGGGYTGDGARTGGMDGKGGFLAMMHPDETVIDHRRGGPGSGGGNNTNNANVTQVFQLSDNARREAKQQILESAPMIQQMAKQAVLQAINQGGAMSRAVGRRS